MQQDYKTEMRAMTEGLAEWCHRRERRQRTTRALIGTAAVVVTVVALLVPQDSGIAVDGNLQCCVDDACDRVNIMLAMI